MKTLSQSDVKVLKEALETALKYGPSYRELRDRSLAALAILDAQEAGPPKVEGELLPIWLEGGYGRRITDTALKYLEEFIYNPNPDECADEELTERERQMIHDFIHGMMDNEYCGGILQEMARAALPQPAQPQGDFVMVPRGPTEEMVSAAVRGMPISVKDWGSDEIFIEIWEHMLSAAPQPGAMKGAGDLAEEVRQMRYWYDHDAQEKGDDHFGKACELADAIASQQPTTGYIAKPLELTEEDLEAWQKSGDIVIVPKQPAPSDARGLAKRLTHLREYHTDNDGMTSIGPLMTDKRFEDMAVNMLTAFANSIRAKALDEAASIVDARAEVNQEKANKAAKINKDLEETAKYSHRVGALKTARDAIRALAKRGGL